MADLGTLASVSEIVGGLVVVGGVAFAVVQLRQFRRQRQDAATFAFFQSWASTRSLAELDRVYALPDGAGADEVDGAGTDTREAAYGTYLRFELLGLMVYQRTVTLEAANEWAGGAVRICWRKLRPWIEAKRRASGSQRPGEWFQWLAERLDALPARDEAVGAFVAHRDWRG